MSKKYVLIVRNNITLFSPKSDEILEMYGCYYKSPEFTWNGSLASLGAAIDSFRAQFIHFLDWSAKVVAVE